MINKYEISQAEDILNTVNITQINGDTCYILQTNDEICAVQMSENITIAGENGIFLYSPIIVKAQDDMRIAKEMIDYITKETESLGIKLICTETMTEQISAVYVQLGFKSAFSQHCFTREVRSNLWSTADFDTITANKLKELRLKYIVCPYMDMEKDGYTRLMTRLYGLGASTAVTDNGYAIYFKDSSKIYIKEMFALNDADGNYILQAIANHDSRNNFVVDLAMASCMFSGEGISRNAGMYKYNGTKQIDFNLVYNTVIEV